MIQVDSSDEDSSDSEMGGSGYRGNSTRHLSDQLKPNDFEGENDDERDSDEGPSLNLLTPQRKFTLELPSHSEPSLISKYSDQNRR